MPEKPSRGGHTEEYSVDDDEGTESSAGVDGEVKRRLREAYLNDEESALIVTGVRSAGRHVVVELKPPHGEATHVERFHAPRNGSLRESETFLAFLDAAGVSPLDVDELIGTRVPATYDDETGWRLDDAYLSDGRDDGGRLASAWKRSTEWLWTYRYWLLAVLLVGGELLFVAVILLVYT